MGKKSAKASGKSSSPAAGAGRSGRSLFIIGPVAVVIAAGAFLYMRSGGAAPTPSPETPAVSVPAIQQKAHPQAKLPPLEYPSYPMQRSRDVVDAAYRFAAEHPEVLSYVPCYCGCEHQGHRGNEDCFVKGRDVNGDVVEWDPHGMECAVCLDVATRSRIMFENGSSVRDIRQAIEKEWNPRIPTHTPTPQPN